MSVQVKSARLALAIGATLIALTGCSQAPDSNATLAQASRNNAPAPTSPFGSEKRLAISHVFTLRMPNADVEPVQQKHMAECSQLGCTILSTNLDRSNEGRISARSSLRIAPEAYASFAATIAAPPVTVTTHSETAEDKFVAVDNEKRLEGKSALRDRLVSMLRDPAVKGTADIIAVEKELAQVQGEIETATAQRDYLRTITGTVRVDINYNGQAALVGGFDFSPITRAINGMGPTFAGSAAALISFLAMILPWLPLAAFIVWAIRRAVRRWKRPKPA